MAFTVKIYRKNNPSDTYNTLPTTDKLIFNLTKDNTVANGFISLIEIPSGRDIAENPNPNQNLSESQDTGLGEITFTITGTISRGDDVSNAWAVNLASFRDGQQESNTMPFGRFCIEMDRLPAENVIADATKGLKVSSFKWTLDEDVPNADSFVLQLTKAVQAT